MMMDNLWQIIDSGKKSAEENMRADALLLQQADRYAKPILHFYEWEGDCATYGYFIRPSQLLDLEKTTHKGLNLARRPTGGGVIFHMWDMAFSVLVPAHLPEYSMNTMDNYAFVNRAVLNAAQDFLHAEQGAHALSLIEEDGIALHAHCQHFCMAKPTKYDVMWEGKKIAGAAQRKTKLGFLHQGSISLTAPSLDYLNEILVSGASVSEAMQTFTFPLLPPRTSLEQVMGAKEKLKALLATHLNSSSLKYRSQRES